MDCQRRTGDQFVAADVWAGTGGGWDWAGGGRGWAGGGRGWQWAGCLSAILA